MKRILLPLLTISLISCARVQTLNLQPHSYSERPKHIVWIQIAGFTEGHLPLLRFNVADAGHKTNMEQVDCVGKMWSYNLYQLRPEASKSFISQMTGSKNIKGTCEDYEAKASTSYLENIGYEVAVLESGAAAEQSLEKALGCSNNNTLDLSKMRLYKMGAESSSALKTFHYQDSPEQVTESMKPGMYYDRSCQKGICYSSLSNNFKTLWSRLTKDRLKTFFIVRDFNFQKALKKKDLTLAKEALLELDRIVGSFPTDRLDEILVIVSGAESQPMEFPLQGKEWSDFEKTGKNVIYKNTALMSPVLARGPMAENFCGIFDESEMLKRVIYKPEGKKFNWDSVNPF
ncbi:hypothetical protein SHI21_10085 [Bacteriovorax sp. PP10]|uniref:Lipoprotein n=1 Tax=Bacteriovorax antarcticus TaxID=3088717 RepID=A0ABU5VX08_9BACT|nr:hypothetical protein [Bacteriovorax sp. PP10]MEA9356555.1 hypothetical protein [Bacteriovorax sp. PP10]